MSDAPLLGLALRLDAAVPLTRQIVEALRRRIIEGQLRPGERLPPSRRLAEELGLSRTTIVNAYDQLVAEGFATSRPGAGLYVSEIGEVERRAGGAGALAIAKDIAPTARTTSVPAPAASPRPFHPGPPDMRQFPYRQWARCVSRAARTAPEAMVHMAEPFGDALLRAEICRYLAEWRGVSARPEQILLTAGSGDALEVCLRAIGEGGPVAIENPCYPPLAAFAQSLGLPVRWLQVDAGGACLPETDHKEKGQGARVAVLTPSSQFPLGGAMPLARRNSFLHWAAQTGGWIIEDDYDSEFRYAGQPIPALASLDARTRTLYVGSFSKVFSHGFRLGFVVVPERLIARFEAVLARYGGKAAVTAQRPLALFMAEGEFYRHIRRVRRIYAERREVLTNLLATRLAHVGSFADHRAGMHIAFELPDAIDDAKLGALAAERGLNCPALSSYCRAAPVRNGVLLGFCAFTPEELRDAFDSLCACIDETAQS